MRLGRSIIAIIVCAWLNGCTTPHNTPTLATHDIADDLAKQWHQHQQTQYHSPDYSTRRPQVPRTYYPNYDSDADNPYYPYDTHDRYAPAARSQRTIPFPQYDPSADNPDYYPLVKQPPKGMFNKPLFNR